MYDKIENILGALIQHGPLGDRIYLMKTGNASSEFLIPALLRKATECKYGKIFAKVQEDQSCAFVSAGFQIEAQIPSFYGVGQHDAHFLGYYLDRL